MHLIKIIFKFLDPVSNYLQSKPIDFIDAIKYWMIYVTKNQLKDFRDQNRQYLVNELKSKMFCRRSKLNRNTI